MKQISKIPEKHSVQICISEFFIHGTQNFYLAIVPDSRLYKGHQWHRDIFPAMRRYTVYKVFGTNKRPIPKNKGIDYKFNKTRIISSLDCILPEQYNAFINATKNENKYQWAIYNPETREMEEVKFI